MADFRVPPIVFSPMQRLQLRAIVPSYLHGYWGSNSCPHACEASTLLDEPNTQILFSVCLTLQWLQPSRTGRVHLSERTFNVSKGLSKNKPLIYNPQSQQVFPKSQVPCQPLSHINIWHKTRHRITSACSKPHRIIQTSQTEIPSFPHKRQSRVWLSLFFHCLLPTKAHAGSWCGFAGVTSTLLLERYMLGKGIHFQLVGAAPYHHHHYHWLKHCTVLQLWSRLLCYCLSSWWQLHVPQSTENKIY